MLELFTWLKIKRLNFNFVIASILLTSNVSVFAITGDTKHPIQIESYIQLLDMRKNMLTFIGHVIMVQGTIKINADKLVATHLNSKENTEIIDGYGNPATFCQVQDNGKLLKGHALRVHYELAQNYIVLTGNAYLDQFNNKITSDKIIYLIKEKKIQAFSKKGKYVTMVLMPLYLNNKK